MTQFFLSVHREKILSNFDLKSWVTGGTKIWPNFLGQKDSIFFLSEQRDEIESFWLKSWVTGGIKIRPNFLGQNDSIFSLGAPREKIEPFWPSKLSHWWN